MTVEYISVEKYKVLLNSIKDEYNLELALVLHDGYLYRITDLYTKAVSLLVPDTGLMRVLV